MKIWMTLMVLFAATAASAHVAIDHTLPAVGATVDHAPKEIKLWFDGPVGVSKSQVEVLDSDAKSLVSGDLHGDPKDDTVLIIPIRSSAGKLTVKWNAYCPSCDHTTHGTFTITVGP